MFDKNVSEMSIKELEKYRQQLSEELAVVNFYLSKMIKKNITKSDRKGISSK